MNSIYEIVNMVTPVADGLGIGQAWRDMVVERSSKACALASLAATGKGHADLMALADRCFDHAEAEAMIRATTINARNIVARMQRSEVSDEA